MIEREREREREREILRERNVLKEGNLLRERNIKRRVSVRKRERYRFFTRTFPNGSLLIHICNDIHMDFNATKDNSSLSIPEVINS